MADPIVAKGVFTSSVTLSGIGQASDGQSVDGAGEVWFATANGTDNGVWISNTGAWTRHTSLDISAEFVWGQEVYVKGGNKYYGSVWYYNGIDNPTLGSTTLYFNLRSYGYPESELEGIQASYIEGLGLSYVDANTVGLSPGQAYVPGLGKVLTVDADQTATRLPGNNNLYYAYLEEYPAGSGLGRLRLITTAPSEPYLGSAATQGDDTTVRYLGMLRNDGSGNLIPFDAAIMGGETVLILYGLQHNSISLRVLDNVITGTTISFQDIGPSATTAANRLVSPAARTVRVFGRAGSTEVWVGYPSNYPSFGVSPAVIPANAVGSYADARVSNTQRIGYMSGGSDTLTLFVTGYYEHR